MRALFLLLAVACGPGATNTLAADPGDMPPLPPSSSTSVELLIEHRAELELSGRQIEALRQLEAELTRLNEPLDAQLAQMERRLVTAAGKGRESTPKGMSGGMRAGGMSGGMRAGGMNGGMRAGGMSGGMHGGGKNGGMRGGGGKGGAPGSGASRLDRQEMRAKIMVREQELRQKKIDNNAAALNRAFDVLGDHQRDRARRILEYNGHDAPDGHDPPADGTDENTDFAVCNDRQPATSDTGTVPCRSSTGAE